MQDSCGCTTTAPCPRTPDARDCTHDLQPANSCGFRHGATMPRTTPPCLEPHDKQCAACQAYGQKATGKLQYNIHVTPEASAGLRARPHQVKAAKLTGRHTNRNKLGQSCSNVARAKHELALQPKSLTREHTLHAAFDHLLASSMYLEDQPAMSTCMLGQTGL